MEKKEVTLRETDQGRASETTEIIPPLQRSAHGTNLYQREVLYNEVWQQPVTKVAERYGVSDVMIHKACKTLNIPVPPRGYWAKKAAGHPVKREPLPKDTDKTEFFGNKIIDGAKKSAPPLDDTLGFLREEDRIRVIKTALQLQVNSTKRKLHPVLMQHKANYASWAKLHPRKPYAALNRDPYRQIPDGESPLYEKVSESTLPRLYHILDALYSAIEELGGSVNQDLSVQIRGEHVTFKVSEGQERIKHTLTKDEVKQLERYEKEKRIYTYTYEPKFRKYDYLPTGRLTFSACRDSYIRDSSAAGIESRVGELLLGLYMESEAVRIEREVREEAQRRAEEEARQEELRRQSYNDEVDRLIALKNEAADYQMACQIRAYVSAVESEPNLDPSQIEWITWAKAKADWYDPTVKAADPVFGLRDRSDHKGLEKIGSRRW